MCILPPIICFELAIWYQIVVCCESELAAPDSFTIIQPADAAAGFQMKVSIILVQVFLKVKVLMKVNVFFYVKMNMSIFYWNLEVRFQHHLRNVFYSFWNNWKWKFGWMWSFWFWNEYEHHFLEARFQRRAAKFFETANCTRKDSRLPTDN